MIQINKEFLKSNSFAVMYFNEKKVLTNNEALKKWYNPVKRGDFDCDTENGRIIIRNAKSVIFGGSHAGNGPGGVYLYVNDSEGYHKKFTQALWQVTGYYNAPIPTGIVDGLDENEEYYLIMEAGGYNGDYQMNNGFGGDAVTKMWAVKLL